MRKTSQIIYLAVLIILAVASCAAAYAEPDISLPLGVQWAFSMGPDPTAVGTPAFTADRVYVSHRGTVHCLDRRTGAEQWTFSVERAAIITSPVVWKNLVIVGATNATLYGLDGATGRPVWERICASSVVPDPLLVDDMLMVGAGQMVYAMSPETGDATWICALETTAKAGPVTDGSMLYFLGSDGSVQCVDGTAGRFRWRVGLSVGPRVYRPIVAGGRAIVASGNRVYGVSRSGSVAWTAEMPAAVGATPSLIDDMMFIPCVDGQIYVLYGRSGAPRRHTIYKVDHCLTSSPVVTASIVAVGSADGLVFAFDRASGDVRWIYRCRAPDQLPTEGSAYGVYAPLRIIESQLYCLTGTGDLYKFSGSAPDTGGPVWGDFRPDPGSALPGAGYYGPACSVVDDVSGVDPTSVRGSIDGVPMSISFDVVTGVAQMQAIRLDDGSHIVEVSAKDFRGNETSAKWSFVTDASIVAAPSQQTLSQTGRMGRVGGR